MPRAAFRWSNLGAASPAEKYSNQPPVTCHSAMPEWQTENQNGVWVKGSPRASVIEQPLRSPTPCCGRGNANRSQFRCYNQASTLNLALAVTVTTTFVDVCVPSVTVNTLVLLLLSMQETSTPAGAAPVGDVHATGRYGRRSYY